LGHLTVITKMLAAQKAFRERWLENALCFFFFWFCFLVLADFPKSRKSWLKEQLKCRQSQSGQVKHKNEAPKTKKNLKNGRATNRS